MAKSFTPAELHQMLDDALTKFGSVSLPEPSKEDLVHYSDDDRWMAYLKPEYQCYPDAQRSFLGKGGYGSCNKVKSSRNPNEGVRCVKVIVKARVCTNALQIQHMCAELAVSGLIDHPQLNHRTGLFHTKTHMFIILELCGGPRADVFTRIAHVIANRRPQKISEIEAVYDHWIKLAQDAKVDTKSEEAFGDFVDRTGLINKLAVECGANLAREKPELPTSCDLFGLIVANRKLPDPVAQVILRGIILALNCLHQHFIVHRDMKTENVVIGITRRAQLKKDGEGKAYAVQFLEKYDVKVIDFGLVKYLNVNDSAFGTTVTPGGYKRATEAAVAAQKAKETKEGDDEGEDENDPFGSGEADDIEVGQTNKAAQEPGERFNACSVTPACTEIYAPFEVIHGILQNGVGRHKWSSSKTGLPKVDVYGAGTILFCMSNGRPPFRPAASSAPMSREEKMKAIERQILVGPTFSTSTSQLSKEMTLKMMIHDSAMRPTAEECLGLPFISHIGDSVMMEFNKDGTKMCGLMKEVAKKVEEGSKEEQEAESGIDHKADEDLESAILAAARNREDEGDFAGKAKAGTGEPGSPSFKSH